MCKAIQDFSPRVPPLEHQVEAIRYLAEHPTAALFDEQGLGKTKMVIDALCVSMRRGEVDGVLVVAPVGLLPNWEQEVRKHSYLFPVVLRGSQREVRYKFLTGANFYIINYEAVAAALERVARFCKSRRIALVLDEAARIKNPETKTAKALFKLSPLAEKRIIVTGTPVANKPIDIWAQFYFLDQGRLLGADFRRFCTEYDESKPDYAERLGKLRETVSAHSIRRTKEAVLELPEKSFVNVMVELTGGQARLYDEVREQLRVEVAALDGTRFTDECQNILKKLLRLTQIASNPGLIDKGFEQTPAKFPVVDGIVRSIVDAGEKVVVWSSFVENVLLLRNRFKDLNALAIHGEVPMSIRARHVERFQTVDKYSVLVANPTTAGEGLTLTAANHAVYADRNFSLRDYLQSQDRIHRISQAKPCVIHKILAKGTIDEYIDRIIDVKSDIAAFVQGEAASVAPRTVDTLLNRHELLEALGG